MSKLSAIRTIVFISLFLFNAKEGLYNGLESIAFANNVDSNMEISPTDQRHLEHAIGYLELGMLDDALRELDETDLSLQNSEVGLKLRIQIFMASKNWEDALALGRKLCKEHPCDDEAYIHTAFCLHELTRTREAKETLLSGPTSLQQKALFHYNLGCYHAQLGELDEAIECVKRAIKMDKSYYQIALDDPDLTSISDRI